MRRISCRSEPLISSRSKPTGRQIDALHGLRGVAALCVAIGHSKSFTGIDLAAGDYLAVDLFFVLSGFVISHAYDRKLAEGMSLFEFAHARILRLYPLYVLATIISVGWVIAEGNYSRLSLAASGLAGLLFLPAIPSHSIDPRLLFPLDGPAWSLFWELIVNAIFAVLARHLTQRRLGWIVAVGAAALLCTAWHDGNMDAGAYWQHPYAGGVRVLFSFFMGVYLRRCDFRYRGSSMPTFWLLIAIVAIVMLAPVPNRARWLFDSAVILAAWPSIIVLASRISIAGPSRKAAHVSGEVSYSIYVMHMPLVDWLVGGLTLKLGVPWGKVPLAYLPLVILSAILIASFAHFAYDVPIRRWIKNRRRPGHRDASVTQF